jgi:hypothetical protein
MKKLAVLVTTLVLGASSVALADHAYAPSSSEIRDHRAPNYGRWTPRPATWSTLSSHSTLLRGRAVIDVNSRQRFTKLSLDTLGGSMFVDKVLIVFGNGQTQTVDLDKRLASRSAPLMIDLAGNSRMIDKVIVVGKSRGYRSSFALKAI